MDGGFMNKSLPDAPSMEHLKTQARRLLASFNRQDPAAIQRIATFHATSLAPDVTRLKLADAQLVVAREHGFASWQKLKRHVEGLANTIDSTTSTRKFRQIVAELHLADVAAAAKFFEEDLGFKRGYTIAYPDGTLDFAVMVNDPVELLLHNISSDIRADIPKHIRLYFRAVDVRALHASLLDRRASVSPLQTTDYGSIEFSVIGPEGYGLVFQQFV
jgi:hypothetical protein